MPGTMIGDLNRISILITVESIRSIVSSAGYYLESPEIYTLLPPSDLIYCELGQS